MSKNKIILVLALAILVLSSIIFANSSIGKSISKYIKIYIKQKLNITTEKDAVCDSICCDDLI